MTREDFLKEAHDYIDTLYSEYNRRQDMLKEIITEVHRVCEKNGIRYVIAYGSLLGAVRDGDDVLPWDYDYDIIVPVTDVGRLIEALKTDLGEDFYFVSNYTTKNYRYNQIRVGKKGYPTYALHVDIFYAIGAPADEKKRNELSRRVNRNFVSRIYSTEHYFPKELSLFQKFVSVVTIFKRWAQGYLRPVSRIAKEFEKLISLYDMEKTGYCLIVVENGKLYENDLFDRKLVSLGQHDVYFPKDTEKFLTATYGDYRRYLPIKARFEEFYHGYQYITNTEKWAKSEF